MAIYHFSAQIISRSNGSSSVASSAYRAGEKLEDERTGVVHDYTKKGGVEYTEILTPNNAPEWAKDRQSLWNEVEKIEKGKKSQLTREINIALPKELSLEKQIELIKEFTQDTFVNNGMVADIAIHDNKKGNPHAHIMLTIRAFDEEGQWLSKQKKEYILDKHGNKQYDKKSKTYKCKTVKTTDWDNKENLEKWREEWSKYANRSLERNGFDERIDHRTLKDQGLEKIATKHEGYAVRAMEGRGIETEIGSYNKAVSVENKKIELLERQIKTYEIEKGVMVNGRVETNGDRNRDTRNKTDSKDAGARILYRNITGGNEIRSSRANEPIGATEKGFKSEPTGERRTSKETSTERGSQTGNYRKDEQINKSSKDRSGGYEEIKLSENRGHEQQTNQGNRAESRVQQESNIKHNGSSIPGESNTKSNMERESQAVFNPTSNNSRNYSSGNGGISTGNAINEILKTLEGVTKESEQRERESIRQEKSMLKKKKKTRSKNYDIDYER